MGRDIEISGFSYSPSTEMISQGTIFKYNFSVSKDGKEWIKCDTAGELSNIMHNPVSYFIHFGKSYNARYFKLEPTREINNRAFTSVWREIRV